MKKIDIKILLIVVLCSAMPSMWGMLLRRTGLPGQSIRQGVRTVYKPGVGSVRAARYFSTIANKSRALPASSVGVGMGRLMSTPIGRSNAPLSVPIGRVVVDNSFNTPQVAAALQALEPKLDWSKSWNPIIVYENYTKKKNIHEGFKKLFEVGSAIGTGITDSEGQIISVVGDDEIYNLRAEMGGRLGGGYSASPSYEMTNAINTVLKDGHTIYYHYTNNFLKSTIEAVNKSLIEYSKDPGSSEKQSIYSSNRENLSYLSPRYNSKMSENYNLFSRGLGAQLNEKDISDFKKLILREIEPIVHKRYDLYVKDFEMVARAINFLIERLPRLFDKIVYDDKGYASWVIFRSEDGKEYRIDLKKIMEMGIAFGVDESMKTVDDFKKTLIGQRGNKPRSGNAIDLYDVFDFVKKQN